MKAAKIVGKYGSNADIALKEPDAYTNAVSMPNGNVSTYGSHENKPDHTATIPFPMLHTPFSVQQAKLLVLGGTFHSLAQPFPSPQLQAVQFSHSISEQQQRRLHSLSLRRGIIDCKYQTEVQAHFHYMALHPRTSVHSTARARRSS